MSLFDQISNDIKEAMKAKDKVRLETLRNVKKVFLEAKTAPGANDELTDDTALKLIQKLVKQGKDSAEIYKGQGREDLAEGELAQVAVLEAYLPKQMSEAELEAALKAIIAEVGATSAKDMGKVMGVATKRLAGQAEGRAITGTDLYLYASDGTLYKHIECGTERHEERVPADTYIILAVNADCSNAACDEEGDSDECCMQAEDDTDNKGALLHVDKVYCTGTDSVIVKRGNIPTEVTLYPQNVVKYLHFNLDPGYITRIVGMEVRMSGAVPSVYLMDGEDTGDPVRDIMATATEQGDRADRDGDPVAGGYRLRRCDMTLRKWAASRACPHPSCR